MLSSFIIFLGLFIEVKTIYIIMSQKDIKDEDIVKSYMKNNEKEH